jgi:hypothetical protein
MTIVLHGIAIAYIIDGNGIVTLRPTAAQIRQLITVSGGNIAIDLGALTGVTVNGVIFEFHPVWFDNAMFDMLKLTVPGLGSVMISSGVLSSLVELDRLLRFSLQKRSLLFDILTASDGRTINYNDPANPLFISIPVALAANRSTYGHVAVMRTTNGNVTMPYSIISNNEVVFQTAQTGTFDTAFNARAFADTGQHWAANNISFMAARGLVSGVGNDLFSPETPMTRAMFAQVLANIEGADLSALRTSRFTDVAVTAWYAPAVEWAASVGIVRGVGSDRFAPDISITRQEMAAMLISYADYKGYELPAGQAAAFSDEASIASWAYDAVKLVQAAGIITGKPGNVFAPHDTATRAEVATILARFIGIYMRHALDLGSQD